MIVVVCDFVVHVDDCFLPSGRNLSCDILLHMYVDHTAMATTVLPLEAWALLSHCPSPSKRMLPHEHHTHPTQPCVAPPLDMYNADAMPSASCSRTSSCPEPCMRQDQLSVYLSHPVQQDSVQEPAVAQVPPAGVPHGGPAQTHGQSSRGTRGKRTKSTVCRNGRMRSMTAAIAFPQACSASRAVHPAHSTYRPPDIYTCRGKCMPGPRLLHGFRRLRCLQRHWSTLRLLPVATQRMGNCFEFMN